MMNQLGADEHNIVSWAREIMTKFVGHGTVPLDSFLLDEENPAILAMLEKAHRKSVVEPTDTDIGADGRKGKGASDWAPKHFKITSELGKPWWKPSQPGGHTLSTAPGPKHSELDPKRMFILL